jgi:predicted nucleic acid-binding protein
MINRYFLATNIFSLYQQALSVQDETGFSFYDSLIVAGALESQCRWLNFEDLQAGRSIRGLAIRNPFAR